MTQQPGDVLDEAVKLFEVLSRRIRDSGPSRSRPQPDDVWAQATHDHPTPHIATGAAERRCCPVCRAIAVARISGPDIVEHLMDAGRFLHTALRETLSAFDRSASGTTPRRERATPTPPAPRQERHGDGGNPGDSG